MTVTVRFVAELKGVEKAELTLAEGTLKNFRAALEMKLPDSRRLVVERRFRNVHDLIEYLRSPDIEDSIRFLSGFEDDLYQRAVVQLLLDLAARLESSFPDEPRRDPGAPGDTSRNG